MKTKKKIIDIEPEDFKNLSIQAATKGKNLKAYLEENISKLAKKKIA